MSLIPCFVLCLLSACQIRYDHVLVRCCRGCFGSKGSSSFLCRSAPLTTITTHPLQPFPTFHPPPPPAFVPDQTPWPQVPQSRGRCPNLDQVEVGVWQGTVSVRHTGRDTPPPLVLCPADPWDMPMEPPGPDPPQSSSVGPGIQQVLPNRAVMVQLGMSSHSKGHGMAAAAAADQVTATEQQQQKTTTTTTTAPTPTAAPLQQQPQ